MSLNLALRLGAVAPATSSFVPTDLANLALWLDASVAGDFTYSSGSVVSQWNDKSGNARHASQGNTSFQPGRTGTINSLATVVFDGTNDFLSCALPTAVVTSGPWTAFAVVRPLSVAGDRNILDSDGTRRTAQFLRTSGTAAQSIPFNTAGSPFTDAAGVTLSTSTNYQFTARLDATTIETWVDNSSNGATAVTGSLQVSNASSLLGIGCTNPASPSQYWNGHIAEVAIYDAALSTTDRESVQTYLRTKWGTA